MGRAKRSGDLRKFIEAGKKIIISTVQKFPFILDEIGNEQRTRRFAILIDEAHSSQGGRTSASISAALGAAGEAGEYETCEDQINRVMESRKLLSNASYFAFTATPKNKMLEIFGAPDPQPDGAVRHRAFHSYTMKQAIQEGFILDVLAHYTPVASYYRLAKTVEDDPEFDVKKAQKKLRRFVEGHDHAIRLKAEIMVDHFHEQVVAKNKIEPVPTSGGGHVPEPELELDRLSNILQAFNDLFGDIAWDDRDRVGELITKTIPARVAADAAFRNARENSDDANARIEHDKVLARIVTGIVKDDAELFKQFMDNDDFKRWMTARVFELACEQAGAP